jgi:hypothetical protein
MKGDDVSATDTEATGFRIDGKLYEVPTLDTYSMDEAQVLYDYAGLGLEDFVEPDDEAPEEVRAEFLRTLSQKLKNPQFLRSIIHVAYQRGNPEMTRGQVEAVVGAINHMAAFGDFLLASVGEERPPESATELLPPSDTSSVASSASSGKRSSNGSDEAQVIDQPPTGRTRSGTSSRARRKPSAK